VQQTASEYDQEACQGQARPTYLFGHNVLEGDQLDISSTKICIPGYSQPISLEIDNPFKDMC